MDGRRCHVCRGLLETGAICPGCGETAVVVPIEAQTQVLCSGCRSAKVTHRPDGHYDCSHCGAVFEGHQYEIKDRPESAPLDRFGNHRRGSQH